jgi:ADP-ribose pyrophosphatase YjhB (NUDIX family)
MSKPLTPLVGCDAFVLDDQERVLLVQRADNGLWAMPGGCHDLGETPAACAVRECREESGYDIELLRLLGTWSSNCYEYVNYLWKDNEFCHLIFEAKIIGGTPKISDETTKIDWFAQSYLPQLSDGHEVRIEFAFQAHRN